MTDGTEQQRQTIGAWAKRYYFANRAAIDSVLRPHGLGTTQWFVLEQLAHNGPTMQRELGQILLIERPALSSIVATLVRKGLIEQVPDTADQRQRVIHLTREGADLWDRLPDPIAVIRAHLFHGVSAAEMETAIKVLRAGTDGLNTLAAEAGGSPGD